MSVTDIILWCDLHEITDPHDRRQFVRFIRALEHTYLSLQKND